MKFRKFIPMQNKSGIVLAIDPGFDRVGVAILSEQEGKPILLHSECIETKPKDKREKRLLMIGSRIDVVIKDWAPSDLAIESLFFNANTTSALGVAEARGVIIFQAMRAGLAVFEYSPQAIKIAVTGYGKADKISVENMVQKLVKVPQTKTKRLDDELDAIAVGITHLATQKGI
jgi:crossover junction endodeoxyribonuclease RuvC